MLIVLALIFLVTPVLEIYLFIRVGEVLGAFPTIGLVLAAAAVGAGVIRFGAPRAIGMAQDSLRAGVAPVREVLEGVAVVAAGCLLILPGFFTDVLGLLLLIPWTRRFVAYALLYRALSPAGAKRSASPGDVVDGDFEVVRRAGDGVPPPRLPPAP
ncbi:MAG: FxsA family protein [Sphingomonadales bacterium]